MSVTFKDLPISLQNEIRERLQAFATLKSFHISSRYYEIFCTNISRRTTVSDIYILEKPFVQEDSLFGETKSDSKVDLDETDKTDVRKKSKHVYTLKFYSPNSLTGEEVVGTAKNIDDLVYFAERHCALLIGFFRSDNDEEYVETVMSELCWEIHDDDGKVIERMDWFVLRN